jgi:hypothetical protein
MRIQGFTPYKFQEELITSIVQSDEMFHTIIAGRQIGKSLTLINLMLYYVLNNEKTTALWLAPVYAQAVKVLTQITDAVGGAPILKEANKSEKVVSFINGSRIYFRSAEKPETIRGLSVDYLFADEAQDIQDDAMTKSVLPTLTAAGKKAIIAGTPKTRNWFYTFYTKGMDERETDYKSYHAPSSVSPYVSIDFLEEQKRSLPENIYRQEYLAEFQDSEGAVFSNIDGSCVLNEWQAPSGRLYAGLDVGTKQDYSVMCIMDDLGRVVYMWRDRNLPYNAIVDKVVSLAKTYKPSVLLIETNGVGDPIYEQIRKGYSRAEPFVTTNKSKENMVRRLIGDMEDNALELPSPTLFPALYHELQSYQYQMLPSGTIRYSHPSGLHDDAVDALMIANWARTAKSHSKKKMIISSIR